MEQFSRRPVQTFCKITPEICTEFANNGEIAKLVQKTGATLHYFCTQKNRPQMRAL
jgi:hypothetical protein